MFNLKDVLSPASNPYGNEVVVKNIDYCLTLGLPEIFLTPEHAGELNIVGGAPSLNTQLDKLKIEKSPIWAVNGSVNHLINNNIIPKAMVILESNLIAAGMIPDVNIQFHVASQCDKSVFDKLKNKKVKVWHALVEAGENELLREKSPNSFLIGGGCSTVLRCINLGYVMGYRTFNLYGFDCSISEKQHHAYEQKFDDDRQLIDIRYNGKDYLTNPQLARQALDFVDMMNFFGNRICVKVHGEGLAQDIARNILNLGDR
jgi:hypothetical protein